LFFKRFLLDNNSKWTRVYIICFYQKYCLTSNCYLKDLFSAKSIIKQDVYLYLVIFKTNFLSNDFNENNDTK